MIFSKIIFIFLLLSIMIESKLTSIKEEKEGTILFIQNENSDLQEAYIKEKMNCENKLKKNSNFLKETSVLILEKLWKNEFSKEIEQKFNEIQKRTALIQKKVNYQFIFYNITKSCK